jgi:hypothetical protein
MAKFNVGDKVKVVSNGKHNGGKTIGHNFAIGTVGTVVDIGLDSEGKSKARVKTDSYRYEQVLSQEDLELQTSYKPGDRITITELGERTGETFTLTERDPSMDGMGKSLAWRTVETHGWLGENQFELAKEDEKLAKTDVVFRKGDRVKVTDSMTYRGNATVVEQNGGFFDDKDGYLVDTDEEKAGSRSDGYLWVRAPHLEKLSKFNVGDIVRGTPDNPYGITNYKMEKGVVTEVLSDYADEDIRVKPLIIDGREARSYETIEFAVSSEYFELVGPQFKAGDVVASKFDGEEYTLERRRTDKDDAGRGFAWGVKGQLGWIGEDRVTKVETPEVPKKRPTTGDYVKIIADSSGHSFDIGEVVKVLEDDHDDVPYYCEGADHREYLEEDDVELVEGVEVTRSVIVTFLRSKDADEILDIIEEARN